MLVYEEWAWRKKLKKTCNNIVTAYLSTSSVEISIVAFSLHVFSLFGYVLVDLIA